MTAPGKIMLVSVPCFGKKNEQEERAGGRQREKRVLSRSASERPQHYCNKMAFHLHCSGAARKFLQEPRIKDKPLLRQDCSWF